MSAALFVALVIAVVISSTQTAADAIDARNRTESTAERQIARLNDRIEELTVQVGETGDAVGAARTEIEALREQIRRMGGEPVVTTTTTTSRPRSTTTTRPQSTTTSTTTTTTQPSCEREVAGICLVP